MQIGLIVEYAKTVHDSQPLPRYGMWYIRFLLTYKISISYRYRDILAISYRYRIEFQKPISLHHYFASMKSSKKSTTVKCEMPKLGQIPTYLPFQLQGGFAPDSLCPWTPPPTLSYRARPVVVCPSLSNRGLCANVVFILVFHCFMTC